VREHEPEVYAKARLVLLPKDYVRLRLTGSAAMDKADGSGTLLFDLAKRGWSKQVLDALEIPADWLPPTLEGPEPTGPITAEAAAEIGLRAGTPVMAGGGDQAAGAVGAGAVRPGVVALTLGTSGVVFVTTDRPLVEPEGRLHAFCHAVPASGTSWASRSPQRAASSGIATRSRRARASRRSSPKPSRRPPAAKGLLFLPYLSGERTPYPDPLARGAFVGLTVRHRRAHMTRAVLEGVAFSMRDCFSLLKQAGVGDVTQVRVAGGGAKSRCGGRSARARSEWSWSPSTAPKARPTAPRSSAAVGGGAFASVEAACDAAIQVTGRDAPDPAWAKALRRAVPRPTAACTRR
jgi:xylulokinase